MNDIHKLWKAVDEFSLEMNQKLYNKFKQGCRGWNNKKNIPAIKRKLKSHVERMLNGDFEQGVDVANLAMMLWLKRD